METSSPKNECLRPGSNGTLFLFFGREEKKREGKGREIHGKGSTYSSIGKNRNINIGSGRSLSRTIAGAHGIQKTPHTGCLTKNRAHVTSPFRGSSHVLLRWVVHLIERVKASKSSHSISSHSGGGSVCLWGRVGLAAP